MNHLRMSKPPIGTKHHSRAVFDIRRKRPRPEVHRAEATRTKPEGTKGGETWHLAEWQRRQDLIVPYAIPPSTRREQTPPTRFDPPWVTLCRPKPPTSNRVDSSRVVARSHGLSVLILAVRRIHAREIQSATEGCGRSARRQTRRAIVVGAGRCCAGDVSLHD